MEKVEKSSKNEKDKQLWYMSPSNAYLLRPKFYFLEADSALRFT